MNQLHEKKENEVYRQYITFKLKEDWYAFDVMKVKEIIEVISITRVPKSPRFMIGVLNLRGGVVPVIDLRLKFDLPEGERTVDTAIIILEVSYDTETILIGVLVDSVKEVIKLSQNEIELPPRVGMSINREMIDAIGKRDGRFIIVLNSDKIFSEKELNFSREQAAEDNDSVEQPVPRD